VTTVQLITPVSARATIGESWTLRWWMLDADGLPTNAETPTVTVTRPDASTVTLTPDYTIQSWWEAAYPVAAAGRHLVHVASLADAADAALYADMVLTEAGMPTPADVSEYLGARAGGWTMAQITDAYNAERGAQRDKCGERANYPYPLREALLRRVARNLAMRLLPLAISSGDADTVGTLLPGSDPEVRRLEAPYRRRTVG